MKTIKEYIAKYGKCYETLHNCYVGKVRSVGAVWAGPEMRRMMPIVTEDHVGAQCQHCGGIIYEAVKKECPVCHSVCVHEINWHTNKCTECGNEWRRGSEDLPHDTNARF